MFRFGMLFGASVVAAKTLSLQQVKAFHAHQQRHLENANAEQEDISWLADYNILYDNCFHSEQSVAYRLCPSKDSCQDDCSAGGSYVASLAFFIDAFTEAQMEAKEYRCEYARENCQYDDEDMCFQDDNLKYCQQDWGEELDIQEYLECKQIDGENGYFVGPYCGEDNVGIYLGVFTDDACTEKAEDNSAFYNLFEYDLPYADQSIISNKCARCKEHALQEDKTQGDQEDEDKVLEQCEELYAYTETKCEDNIEIENPDTDSCEYIQTLKTNEDIAITMTSIDGNSSRKSLAWVGWMLAALVVGAGIAGYVYRKQTKKNKKRAEEVSTAPTGPSKENLL